MSQLMSCADLWGHVLLQDTAAFAGRGEDSKRRPCHTPAHWPASIGL